MTKTIPDNDVINYIGMVYVETTIELSGPIESSAMCYKNHVRQWHDHGLKNRFFSAIFHRYIGYRTTSKGYWASIIKREEYWKNIEKIVEISMIYWFGTDKSAKKSRVKRRAEQRRKAVKISEIYQQYIDAIYRRYIWEILKIFLKAFLKKYIYIYIYIYISFFIFLIIHF